MGDGFDPEGDLCKAIQSKVRYWVTTSTAMFAAAEAGELGVCRFLWEHGAASTIRTKSSGGATPMHGSCLNGHLDTAQWLIELGAMGDIRTKDNDGDSPMNHACYNGHLHVAKWLFKVGAAEDIRTRTSMAGLRCSSLAVRSP